ncbi:phospholipid carrier-dependent glycosyltransferase [Chloroflexota bacterium]
MDKIRLLLPKLARWEYTPLCLLVFIVLIIHFSTILQPNALIFDESYYVPAARSIIQGTGTDIIEHPPLGQLLIVSGISLFGDGPMGWRFFSVIFGAVSIVLLYLICRQLKVPRNISLLAAFLFSIENISFILGGIAMLDVFCLTFMLASFWAYLKGWHIRAGLFIGLASLAKLIGVLALLVILLHWLLTNRNNKRQIFTIVSVSAASFLLLMPLLDLAIWHKLVNPFERIKVMLEHTRYATFAVYAQSPVGTQPTRPWEWLIRLDSMHYLSYDTIKHEWYVMFYLMISPSVWALIIPSMLFMLYRAIKRSSTAIFVICWFAGTYLIWIPASLITDRISYIFYFYPTIGAICIGIALGITRLSGINLKHGILKRGLRIIIPIYLLISLIIFISLFPGNIWLVVVCSIVLYLIARYYIDIKDTPLTTSDL